MHIKGLIGQTVIIVITVVFFHPIYVLAQSNFHKLPILDHSLDHPVKSDWLLGKGNFLTKIYRTKDHSDLTITNGLVSRTFRIDPYFARYSFKNLITGKEMLRAIRPEATIEINGKIYPIGGVSGQFEYAYLKLTG